MCITRQVSRFLRQYYLDQVGGYVSAAYAAPRQEAVESIEFVGGSKEKPPR